MNFYYLDGIFKNNNLNLTVVLSRAHPYCAGKLTGVKVDIHRKFKEIYSVVV
jgi:hypothetical protein